MADEKELELDDVLDIEIGAYDDNVEEANFLLPPGEYTVRIADLPTPDQSKGEKTKGEYLLIWRLVTCDSDDSKCNDVSLFWRTFITGQNKNRMFGFTRFAEAIGESWDGSRLTRAYLEGLVGQELRVQVQHEEYEGEVNARIKRILPRG